MNPPSWRHLRSHHDWLADETARLLEFARGSRVERGFGWLDAGGVPDPERPLALWITTRMTHVFALGHLLGRGKPDVYHALQATLLPRLPIAPSIAGALRDGLLS
jgi:mannose/cellobiose epimerase-like protein (N-acyl-D-glucosamine 2-epimerase family)